MKDALLSQYRAQFAMLDSCLRHCPPAMWTEGEHPRTFWRIAYHAVFYTHLYLMPRFEDFQPWADDIWHGAVLWSDDERGEVPRENPYTTDDLLRYSAFVQAHLAEWVAMLDLESTNSGFSWYPISKLEHQLVNLRHFGTHIGQLQERLMAVGLEPKWVGSAKTAGPS